MRTKTEEEIEAIVQKRIDYLATLPIKRCSTQYDVSMMLLILASNNIIIDYYMNEALMTKFHTKVAMEFYFRCKRSYNFAISKSGKPKQFEPSTCQHQFEEYCNQKIEKLKREREELDIYKNAIIDKINEIKNSLFARTTKTIDSENEAELRFNCLYPPMASLIRGSSLDLLHSYNLRRGKDVYRFIRLCKACGELIPEATFKYVKDKYGEDSKLFVELAEDYNKGFYEQAKAKLIEYGMNPRDFDIIFKDENTPS